MATSLATFRSLASAPLGRTLRLRVILFGGVREECRELGLQVGQVVHLSERTGSRLILRLREGVHVAVSEEWARFIGVVEA